MSDLSDLKRNIYAKIPSVPGRPTGALSDVTLPSGTIGWKKPKQPFFFNHIWLSSLALLIVFGGALFLLFGSRGFSEDNIQVTIQVPQEVSGISETNWNVTITNKNSVAITDVSLMFEYPQYALALEDDAISGRSSIRAIGRLEADKNIVRTFKARLFGKEEDLQKARVLVSYKAPGISRSFDKEVFSEIKIVSSPLALALQGPAQVQSGAPFTWDIKVSNVSDYDFSNLRVRLVYPQGFTFIDADPGPQFQKTTWEIPSLKIGQEKMITLKGKLQGSIGDTKDIQALVEYPVQETQYVALTQKITTSRISLEPFSFALRANGKDKLTVHTGDTVTVELAYHNNTAQPVDDVAIDAQLITGAIDPTSVQTPGSFDPAAMKVHWDFSTTPELKEVLPNQDGTVSFTFNVKNKLPIGSPGDRNFSIRIISTLTTQNPSSVLPASQVYHQQEFVIPVGTNLAAQVVGDTQDAIFANSGPLPPVVDRQTSYTITWRVTNSSNDVQDMVIVATLPSHSVFTGKKQANFESDNFYYDSDKRQMVWTVKKLPATTGIALPVYEASFQVELTPSSQDVGNIIDIVGSTQVKGIDLYTNEVINLPLYPPVRTDLAGTLRKGQAIVVSQ